MSRFTAEDRKDVQGRAYTQFTTKLDLGSLSFSVDGHGHRDDRGYVLFDVIQEDQMSTVQVCFGMDKQQAREFARLLLGTIHTATRRKK